RRRPPSMSQCWTPLWLSTAHGRSAQLEGSTAKPLPLSVLMQHLKPQIPFLQENSSWPSPTLRWHRVPRPEALHGRRKLLSRWPLPLHYRSLPIFNDDNHPGRLSKINLVRKRAKLTESAAFGHRVICHY